MSDINDFKDLMMWQKGMDIAERCYFLTKLFPKNEQGTGNREQGTERMSDINDFKDLTL